MKNRLSLIAASLLFASCGGTFVVPTPIGPVCYTTPQLIKPPTIVAEK